MPIDYNILLQNRGTQSDPGAAMERGMKMGDMMNKRKEDDALKSAFKAGVVQNADGTQSVDHKRTMAELYKVNPEKAMAYGAEMEARETQKQKATYEKQLRDAQATAQIAYSVNSPETFKAGLAEAERMGLPVEQFKNMSFNEFMAVKPTVVGRAVSVLDRMQMENDRLNRQESRDERRFQHGIKTDERKDRQQEQDVQKLSKDVAGTQDMIGALDEVEQKLGGKLESFGKSKSGDLIKDGKKVDLPGVSLPGVGRTSFYSSEARDLNSAAARVFNATLKDRSGGAVTDNEMERLRREFNEGKYNTEPELVAALQRYKRQTAFVLKNREAGYNPEVVAKYTDQGGRTSKTIVPDSDTQPQTKMIGGVEYRKVQGGWEEVPMPASR